MENAAAMSRAAPPKLLFVATEDWFVRSHFMPMVRKAVAEGYDTVVAARESGAGVDISAAGARFINLPDARGAYGVAALAQSTRRLSDLLRRERPDLVHAIALRPILVALLASFSSPATAHVLAVTGRGYLAVEPSWREQRALDVVAGLIARRVRTGRAALLVENDADSAWVAGKKGLPPEGVVQAPGAGVELELFPPTPEPAAPPVNIGMVSRLIHSKGADIAVAALARLRSEGLDVTLSIAGAPDPDNPAHVPQAELDAWARTPGVALVGRITDVAGFWARMHVACLPSRGGEGLPRSLIEAGACARPLVTTDVPGCRDLVRAEETGLVVAPDDSEALAGALRRLVVDQALRARLGAAARARVEAGYTTRHAADCAAEAWRRALQR